MFRPAKAKDHIEGKKGEVSSSFREWVKALFLRGKFFGSKVLTAPTIIKAMCLWRIMIRIKIHQIYMASIVLIDINHHKQPRIQIEICWTILRNRKEFEINLWKLPLYTFRNLMQISIESYMIIMIIKIKLIVSNNIIH